MGYTRAADRTDPKTIWALGMYGQKSQGKKNGKTLTAATSE